MFYAVLSGFETKEQAARFLNWFEGQGEQDETLGEWLGDGIRGVQCDVKLGMIERPDAWEYKLQIFKEDDEPI
jgi:hypothetical protein